MVKIKLLDGKVLEFNENKVNGLKVAEAISPSLAKGEHFYKQEYCRCIYSLKDTNDFS